MLKLMLQVRDSLGNSRAKRLHLNRSLDFSQNPGTPPRSSDTNIDQNYSMNSAYFHMQKRVLRLEYIVRKLDREAMKDTSVEDKMICMETGEQGRGKKSSDLIGRCMNSTIWGGPIMPSEDQTPWFTELFLLCWASGTRC